MKASKVVSCTILSNTRLSFDHLPGDDKQNFCELLEMARDKVKSGMDAESFTNGVNKEQEWIAWYHSLEITVTQTSSFSFKSACNIFADMLDSKIPGISSSIRVHLNESFLYMQSTNTKVSEAWQKATHTMSLKDKLMSAALFTVQYVKRNAKYDDFGKLIGLHKPEEPGFTSPMPSKISEWLEYVNQCMEDCFQYKRFHTEQQTNRNLAVLLRFKESLLNLSLKEKK